MYFSPWGPWVRVLSYSGVCVWSNRISRHSSQDTLSSVRPPSSFPFRPGPRVTRRAPSVKDRSTIPPSPTLHSPVTRSLPRFFRLVGFGFWKVKNFWDGVNQERYPPSQSVPRDEGSSSPTSGQRKFSDSHEFRSLTETEWKSRGRLSYPGLSDFTYLLMLRDCKNL